jgi:antitoxin (DNA-binding transcriptional repressor) of toxin-antitoxin stability system
MVRLYDWLSYLTWGRAMSVALMSATDFKATCLDVFDRLADHRLERVEVTKRGRVVAVLFPPTPDPAAAESVYGFMQGSVVIPAEIDLTAPVLDTPFEAELGVLHQ